MEMHMNVPLRTSSHSPPDGHPANPSQISASELFSFSSFLGCALTNSAYAPIISHRLGSGRTVGRRKRPTTDWTPREVIVPHFHSGRLSSLSSTHYDIVVPYVIELVYLVLVRHGLPFFHRTVIPYPFKNSLIPFFVFTSPHLTSTLLQRAAPVDCP